MRLLSPVVLSALLLSITAEAGQVLTPVTSWPLTYTHNSLAVAPNGNVYAADDYVGQVDYFSPQGTHLGAWTASGGPKDIAIDHDGFVYVVYHDGRVEKFTPTGVHVSDFTEDFTDVASSIALDGAGNIYVGGTGTTTSVFEFDAIGNFIREFRSARSIAIEVDAEGNVYAVGSTPAEKFSPNGDLLEQLTAGGACQGFNLTDLALDADGHVMLASFISSAVLFVSRDLACLESWTMPPPASAIVQQTLPEHLAFDPAGYVYVQDVMFDRVVKYSYDSTTPVTPVTWGQLKSRYR